jgi:GAF domain-containing protein
VTEPKAAKSFRAAGDRIVRQESASPSIVTRLLAAPVITRRQIATEDDAWSVRLAALATLGQYDALTFVVDAPTLRPRSYNLTEDVALDDGLRAAIDETQRASTTVQTRASVLLADGRTAAAALIVPLVAPDALSGVLVALRVGRSFAAADALTASGVAELVSLELGRELLGRREEANRREALALYELARLALFGDELEETLQSVVTLLAKTLDHDVAHIWLLRSGAALQLVAAYPHEGLRFDEARPGQHNALAEVLHHQRVVRIGHGALRRWVPDDVKELLVAPLSARAEPIGTLVLGRTRGRYRQEDEEFAHVLGRFIARMVTRSAGYAPPDLREPEPLPEWEDEPELTGS